ncbi:ATP-binding protein [Streptomyces sp. NPDC052309]|uniref:ATP-binding protein n=1 Tax=Streptomyces sp. NPDC052309 TaxID=3155421 RepID=UPI003416FCE9
MEPSSSLSPDQLRALFLFEHLDEQRLRWLSQRGRIARTPGGRPIYTQGEAAEYFVVVIRGTVSLRSRVRGVDVEVLRSSRPGVFAGATQAYVDNLEQVYAYTLQAITDVDVFLLPADDFAHAVRSWFPMAVHLLEGLFFADRFIGVVDAEKDRITALGTLAAGLTHELNNPAAAASRAVAALRERLRTLQRQLPALTGTAPNSPHLRALTELQEEAARHAANASALPALQAADAEDDLTAWLGDHAVDEPWRLAPALVAGRISAADLERVTLHIPLTAQGAAIRWLAYSVDIELLLEEAVHATNRIVGLVDAARQHAQSQPVGRQSLDVRDLLDSVLLAVKADLIGAVTVHRTYQPLVPLWADPAELRVVFTALIENALQAMHGRGVLTVGCACDGEYILIEIADTGTGIPEEHLPHIFEPFFTTRPVGGGVGLGLDRAYRLVVDRYRGDIHVSSRPGATCFSVVLPLTPLLSRDESPLHGLPEPAAEPAPPQK